MLGFFRLILKDLLISIGSIILKVQWLGGWSYFSPLSDTMANLLVFFSSIFLHYEIVQNSTHHQAVVKTKQFVRVKVTFVSKYSHTLYIVEEKLK